MPNEFINPNWHVVIIHYPLALLTLGVLIELFSRRTSSLKTAGRWMILLGALLIVPASTLGLYTLRDVVTPGPIDAAQTWREVVQESPWSAAQWSMMKWHLLLMSIAAGLFLLGVVVWLGASDEARHSLRWPVLLAMLVGVGLMSAGAWHSGEAIYRYGTAVERSTAGAEPPREPATQTAAQAGTAPAGMVEESPQQPPAVSHLADPDHAREPVKPGSLEYYVRPLQLHLLLAGLTVATAIAALGVSFRRWNWRPPTIAESRLVETPRPAEPAGVAPRPPAEAGVPTTAPAPHPLAVSPVRPARFWWLTLLFGVGTALAGLWFTSDWRLEEGLLGPLRNADKRADMPRLFFHVIFGTSTVLLTLLLALITWFSRRAKAATIVFAILLLLAVAAQLWLGILLLFDSHHGPLFRFNAG